MKKISVMGLLFLIGCGKVPPGNVGIIVNNLGDEKGVEAKEVGVGYQWLGLFKSLYLFPTFKQNYNWTKTPHEGQPIDESISFQTAEGLEVNADFGISFSIEPSMASKLFQTYRKGITEITDIYIRNHVRDAINETAATMKVEEIYGKGKTILLETVKNKVSAKIKEFGINIDQVYVIGSFRFPEQFVVALNAKLEAQQRASQRENEVKEAEAQARKDVAKAQGEAQATLTRAEAQAKANEKLARSLTTALVEYTKIQKWDGALPQVQGNSLPMVTIK